MTWKKVECPFEKDRKILQYLLTAPAFNEDGTFTNDGMDDAVKRVGYHLIVCMLNTRQTLACQLA